MCMPSERTFRVEDRSIGPGRAIYLVLSRRDISVDSRSIFIIKFFYKWARDASGANIFLRVSSEVHATFIRLVLSSSEYTFRDSLRARDVDEMSSSLISLWLMRSPINNSLLSDEACPRVSRTISRMWVSADAEAAVFVNSFLYYSSHIILVLFCKSDLYVDASGYYSCEKKCVINLFLRSLRSEYMSDNFRSLRHFIDPIDAKKKKLEFHIHARKNVF